MNIIFEDDQIIVCEKPAGMPSQSDKTRDLDMVNALKNYRFEKEKRSNPFIGLIHRLDRPVGGLMVFAKTEASNKQLNAQVQNRQLKKVYYAVVTDDLSSLKGKPPERLEHFLVKNGKTNLSEVTTKENKLAKKAQLEYEVVEVIPVTGKEYKALSLLKIQLLTGRHHQIRVQLSKAFSGIWGDTKYNPYFKEVSGFYKIALFSGSLSFSHPKTKKVLQFFAIPKESPFSEFSYFHAETEETLQM